MVIKYFLALWMTVLLIGHAFTSYAQLPVDPSTVHGHAVIDTVGNHMTIINTPNTILDWQSFSIGTDSSVYFQQQSVESMILNRVTGNDPSHIFGSLGSNGHIWLINPYGVLFGENARIDAAGLVASTMDIANIDFLAKRYHFNSTGISSEIKNQGEIRTSFGGRVWLMGDRVQNEGLIQTPSGQTAIAAGKSVEFVDSGAPNVVVRVKAPENEVVNLGSLVAPSGQVDLHGSIVNQQGIVRADSVDADEAGHIILKANQATLARNSQTQADQGTVNMEVSSTLNNWGAISGKDIALSANEILQQGQIIAQGGNIALTAQTSTYLDGTVDVSNPQGIGGNIRLATNKLEGMAGGALRADGEQGGNIRIEGDGSVAFSSTLAATGNTQGGKIEVTGDRVYLLNAGIDASSGTQGGTVHLGGGWQGSGDLLHAREVMVGVGSEIKANGKTEINPAAKGGEIAVWSTQSSEHYGSLQAKDGGRIEFSSQGVIKQTGDIQAGTGGTVLFDPKNLFVTDDPPSFVFTNLGGLSFFNNTSTIGTQVIDNVAIFAFGDPGANVLLDTFSDDTVGSPPNGPEIPSGSPNPYQGGASYQVINVGGDNRLQVDSSDSSSSSSIVYGATQSILGFVSYDYRIPDMSGATGLNAFGQELIFNPLGTNLELLWSSQADGMKLHVGTTVPNQQAFTTTDTGFVFSENVDYSVAWFFNAITDTVSLAINQEIIWESVSGTGIGVSDAQFNINPSGDSFITPTTITEILNDGTAVTLQANNDITVQSAINVNAVEGAGDLALQAGRNITFDASVTTDNSNLTAIAGDPDADQNNKESGTPTLTITENATLNVGSGTAKLAAINGDFINENGDAAIFDREAGRWLIYARDPATSTESFSNYQKLYNQTFIQSDDPDVSGILFNYSIPAILRVSAPPNPASLTYGDAYPQNFVLTPEQKAALITGFIDGDTVDIVQDDESGTVWNISGIPSTTGNITAGIHDVSYASGLFTDLGYQIVDNSANTNELNVTPKTITATSFTASDKVYDGNSNATITGGVLNGIISIRDELQEVTDAVSLSGSGAFDNKNAGIDKVVTLTSSSLAGADSGNYVLDPTSINNVTDLATISELALNIGIANIVAEDKTYDRNTEARLNGTLINFIPGDVVFLTGTGTFDSKDAGNEKAVNFSRSDLILAGTDFLNYRLQSDFETGTTTADIFKKDLSTGGFAVENKVYDGNTNASLAVNSNTPQGVIEGDSVFFTAGAATFDSKNVGTGKTVTITDIALSGQDVNNYQLSSNNNTATATADITAKDLALSNLIADNKIYDGNVNANVNGTLVGVIEGDTVSLASGTGTFDNKNAGVGKTVTLTGGALAGTDSSNYRLLPDTNNLTVFADITPKNATVNIVAEDKVYDGNTNARISGSLDGLVAGDSISVTGTGVFDNKDTGVNKTVTATNVSFGGVDGGNYAISGIGTALADITKALLIYHADEATRVSGEPITGLTGRVTGFVPGENQANATTGDLIWSTPATENSPVGKYAILGDGLSARNYTFVNDEKNFTALQLVALAVTPSLKQVATDTSIQAVNTATSAARSAIDAGATGKVVDATASASTVTSPASNFGRLSLAQMSFAEMQQLIDFRREFKENLFSDAVSKLEVDPKLSDVMVCTSTRKEDLNTCRITENQRKEIKSKLAEEQQQKQKSIHKVRIASLPQIARKIIVLFGIDQYADKAIPSLGSAIADTEAVGQLFADKLGYDEIRIVKNATRADIIRTLNELSIEMEANDSVVIYYAGHGYMNAKTGNGYWIPSDASAKDPQSWISNTSISEMLANITSKQMVMISDSCYSGAFTKEQKVGLSIKDAKPDDILGKRSVVVMASGGDEPVADEGRGGHSIFAWFLMQALQNVDNWKIGTNIFEQIQNDVKKSFPQIPQYGAAVSAGHQEGGDYLFEFRQLESVVGN